MEKVARGSFSSCVEVFGDRAAPALPAPHPTGTSPVSPPPVWAWKTFPLCQGDTARSSPLLGSVWFKTEFSPLYPNTRGELGDMNPALTSSFPHGSQLGSRPGNKPEITFSSVCYSHRRCQSHIPHHGDALPSLRPSHRRIPQSCGFATGCASHTPLCFQEGKKTLPGCPQGALTQQTSASTRVSQQLSQEDESVIITLSLAGICREVVPWERKAVLSLLKGKLNLFVKGDTGGQAGTGWSSKNRAPSPLLLLQINLGLVWIHQTRCRNIHRDLYPPNTACRSTWSWGRDPEGSNPWQSCPWRKENHPWSRKEVGFPPSLPFQAVGRARRSRGAAGRAKVTAASPVVTV